MSEIKNIFYECLDCKFKCKTKKEMQKHIKTIKCFNEKTKLEKKYFNSNNILIPELEDLKNCDIFCSSELSDDEFKKKIIENYNKTSEQMKIKPVLIESMIYDYIKTNIKDININIKEGAFDSIDNFYNKDYINKRIFYFLTDIYIKAIFFYLTNNKFNPRKINIYEKWSMIQCIRQRYLYYLNCPENEIKEITIKDINDKLFIKKYYEDINNYNSEI